jgi:Zn-finger nucleic acid-binding protein
MKRPHHYALPISEFDLLVHLAADYVESGPKTFPDFVHQVVTLMGLDRVIEQQQELQDAWNFVRKSHANIDVGKDIHTILADIRKKLSKAPSTNSQVAETRVQQGASPVIQRAEPVVSRAEPASDKRARQQRQDGADSRSISPILPLRLADDWEIKRSFFRGFVITYPCPHCRNELQSTLDDAGCEGKCPRCGGKFTFFSGAERDQIHSAIAAVYEQRRQRRAEAEEAEAEAKRAAIEAKHLKAEAKRAAAKAKRQARLVRRRKMWESVVKRYWKRATLIAAVATVAFCLLWAAGRLLSPNRYTIVNAGNGVIYKIDRRTGEMWRVTRFREDPIKSSE